MMKLKKKILNQSNIEGWNKKISIQEIYQSKFNKEQ